MRSAWDFLIASCICCLWALNGWAAHREYIETKYPAVWMPAEFTIKDGEQVSTKSIEYRVRLTGEAR